MGTWLEAYDVLFWTKNRRVYVSRNYPMIVYALSKKGFKILCDGSELLGRLSSKLDEENGALDLAEAIKGD